MRILVMHSDKDLLWAIEETINRFLESSPKAGVNVYFHFCDKTIDAYRIFNEVQPDIVILNHRWSPNPEVEETGLAFAVGLLRGLNRPVQFIIASADGSISDQCQKDGIQYVEANFKNITEAIEYQLELA